MVLAFAAAFATSAHAQSYTSGDLLLGFSEAGASNDYVVNLGLASTFTNASPGSSFTVSDGNIGADLSSSNLFNSGWASNSSVQFGIVGDSGTTLFFTAPAGTPALTERAGGTVTSIEGQIASLGSDFDGQTIGTANSSVALIESASGGSSWASLSDNGGVAFKYTQTSNIVSNTIPSSSVLDLYELVPHSGTSTPGTLLGDFTLSSGGVLTFQAEGAAAVPEPSTYALMGAGLAVLFWRVRRKTAQA